MGYGVLVALCNMIPHHIGSMMGDYYVIGILI